MQVFKVWGALNLLGYMLISEQGNVVAHAVLNIYSHLLYLSLIVALISSNTTCFVPFDNELTAH